MFKQSFNRPNLRYQVREKSKSIDDIIALIKTQYAGKCGIIYCLSRKNCEEMSTKLTKQGINSAFYHAGLDSRDRNRIQMEWVSNSFQVIVATIAFGMGIDKSDVRFVIHSSLPNSLEGYYQETGRAGRDGRDSLCILYYSYTDTFQRLKMIDEGEGSYDVKEGQKFNLRQVITFCENVIDCRRKQVLHYFGEEFDPVNCNKTCDNCQLGSTYEIVDITDSVEAIIGICIFY